MAALRLQMLGTFAGWAGRQPLLLPPTQKAQSLLAYLLLHRARPQPRDRLIGLYWPDYPETRARHSLATALWHLRRCLPTATLLSDTQQVQLNPATAVALDVEEFRALAGQDDPASLQAAVALYRGDFLDGFFDDWVIAERNRLHDLLVSVLGRLAASHEAAGAHREALVAAFQLLEGDPLQEEAHRVVMRAYCRLGQRDAALAQYARCQDVLREELGMAPEAATTALYAAIREGRFAVGPAAGPSLDPGPQERPPGGALHPLEALRLGRMVGREADLAFLGDHWQAACAGRGGLVLLPGEAGVGKTRLLEEFAGQVARQARRVLRGRCYEFERSLPYQPFPDLLRGVLELLAPREVAACPPWALTAAAQLAPELAEAGRGLEPATTGPLPGMPPALTSTDLRDTGHLFEGLARFFVSVAASEPLLIILDDLHWASESCLQLLHYLTRRIGAHAILLVGSFRPEALDGAHPLAALARDLHAEGLAATRPTLPLLDRDVETMLRELSGNTTEVAPLAARLWAETEGNPFFLIEMLRALFETGVIQLAGPRWQIDLDGLGQAGVPLPTSVEQAIQMRTARLGPDAADALGCAAVLGQEFDFRVLEQVWGRGEEATLAALDELLRRRLLAESDGRASRDYSFAHKLIQEAVYAGLARQRREHLHALAGAALEQVYARELADVAGELGYHYRQAQAHDPGLADKAITYLIRAGDRARDLDMLREASGYYEQARALLGDQPGDARAARVYMKLGHVQHRAREFGKADAAYRQGFRAWQRASRAGDGAALSPAPHALRMQWFEPSSLNPLDCGTTQAGYVVYQLFSGLVEISADLEVVPAIARSWEILDRGCRYVFHLTEEARWSDGHPVTAGDFELSMQLMLAPGTGCSLTPGYYTVRGAQAYNQGRAGVEALGIRATGERTLEVALEEPASYFLEQLGTVVPLPRHCVQAFGPAWPATEHLVSNGPFRLERWERGQSMTLVRNPHCCLRSSGNVECIELLFSPFEDWRGNLARYEADRLDLLDLSAFPAGAAAAVKVQHADEYRSGPALSLFVLFLNCSAPPFDNLDVRRAFVQAIDREALAHEALSGEDIPATGGFVLPHLPGHSPGIGLTYDPEQARRLLADAGYPGGQGLPVLRCRVEHERAVPLVGAYLQRQWADVLGVQSAWNVFDLTNVEGVVEKPEPHVTVMGITPNYPDPDCLLRPAPLTYREFHLWQNPEYDWLIGESTHRTDREARFALLRQADRVMMEGAACVPLVYPSTQFLVKPWVKEFASFSEFQPHLRDVVIEPH